MFGYVTPCKMELKIKEYEKIKAYYCGLCKAIKDNFGNLPRLALNYDISFLSIFLDSLEKEKNQYIKKPCILHPFKKRLFIINNAALYYAAFLNVTLVYYNLLDNIKDDNSIKSQLSAKLLKNYFKKIPSQFKYIQQIIIDGLKKHYSIENNYENINNLDELSHPFGELTGNIIMAYNKNASYKEPLYHIGYNLGKWIYIMDAFDDLENDMKKNEFNALNNILNKDNLPYSEFKHKIKDRVDFILVSYSRECAETLKYLPLKKNKGIIYNIFHFGLLEKMEIIFSKMEVD